MKRQARRMVNFCGIRVFVAFLLFLVSEATAIAGQPAVATSPTQNDFRRAVAEAKKGDRASLSRVIESISGRNLAASGDSLHEFESLLADSDSQVQLLGATGLAAISNAACKEPLVKFLKSLEPKALQQLPPEQKEGRKWLWRLQAMATAAKMLGRVGDESTVAVLEPLKDIQFAEREDPVGEALAELGAARVLARVRPNADNQEIGRASMAISKIRSPKAAAELMAIIQDRNVPAAIQRSATTSLAEMDPPGAAQFFLAMANDPNRPSNARCQTLLTLGQTHDPAVEKPLLDWAQDSNEVIRPYALTALAVYKPEKYFSRWVDAIVDPNGDRQSRMGPLQLGYQMPRDIVRQQREQLYRSLSATTSDGRPDDQIRVAAWRLICVALNELPPVTLSKSSPFLSSIRSELRSNLATQRQASESPETLDARVEARLRTLVRYTSEPFSSLSVAKPTGTQKSGSFSLQDAVTAAKNGKRDQLSSMIQSFRMDSYVPEEMLPWFTSLIDDNDVQVRALGAVGLCAIHKPESSKTLIRFLNSIDPNAFRKEPKGDEGGQILWSEMLSVWQTAATLARMGDKSAIPALMHVKDTPRAEMSEPVMESLGMLGAVKELASLLRPGGDEKEMMRAEEGLRLVRDPNKVPDLITVVREKRSLAAFEALAEIDSPTVIPFLVSVLTDTSYSPYFRGAAVMLAAKTHDPSVEKPLLELAKDPNVTVRGRALTGLALYKPDVYFARWVDAIVDTQEDPKLRESLPDHGSNYLPRELLGAQREQLYRCLEARDRDGRPYDWVRIKMWILIYNSLREEPPIVLSSPSSPHIFHIKGALGTGLARTGPRASYRDREKMPEERLREIVSYSSDSPERPSNRGYPGAIPPMPPRIVTTRQEPITEFREKVSVAIGEHDTLMVGTPPLPAKINFTVLPNKPEFASVVRVVGVIITDPNGMVVRTINLGAEVGPRTVAWDGRMYDANGPLVSSGLYTVAIHIRVGSLSSIRASDTCKIRVIRPELTVNLEDEGGLDESTLVFNLNGKIIDHSRLLLERTIVTDNYGFEGLRYLRVKYRPSVAELVMSGENILKVDISDEAANRMEQLVYPFRLLPEEDTVGTPGAKSP